MIGRSFVLLLLCFVVKDSVGSVEKTCEIKIFRQTKDEDQIQFLKHVEYYLMNHRTVQIISNFINNGELSLEIRLLVDLSHKTVTLIPNLVKISIRSINNVWPDAPSENINGENKIANSIESVDKEKAHIFIKDLENIKKAAFVKSVKNTFNSIYYNRSNTDVKYQFDGMLQDNIVFAYLKRVSTEPIVIITIKQKIVQSGLKKVKEILISSPDDSNCSLLGTINNKTSDLNNAEHYHNHRKRSTDIAPDDSNLISEDDNFTEIIGSLNSENKLETQASIDDDDGLETSLIVEDDILEVPASIVEDGILETPASIVESSLLERPPYDIEDNVLETPASFLEDDILEVPESVIEDDILQISPSVIKNDDLLEILSSNVVEVPETSAVKDDLIKKPPAVVEHYILEIRKDDIPEISTSFENNKPLANMNSIDYADNNYNNDFVLTEIEENENINYDSGNSGTEIYDENNIIDHKYEHTKSEDKLLKHIYERLMKNLMVHKNTNDDDFFNYLTQEKPEYITNTISSSENENSVPDPISSVSPKVASGFWTYYIKNNYGNRDFSEYLQNKIESDTLGDGSKNIISKSNNYGGQIHDMFLLNPSNIFRNMRQEENMMPDNSYNGRNDFYYQYPVKIFKKDMRQDNFNTNIYGGLTKNTDIGLLPLFIDNNKNNILFKSKEIFAQPVAHKVRNHMPSSYFSDEPEEIPEFVKRSGIVEDYREPYDFIIVNPFRKDNMFLNPVNRDETSFVSNNGNTVGLNYIIEDGVQKNNILNDNYLSAKMVNNVMDPELIDTLKTASKEKFISENIKSESDEVQENLDMEMENVIYGSDLMDKIFELIKMHTKQNINLKQNDNLGHMNIQILKPINSDVAISLERYENVKEFPHKHGFFYSKEYSPN